MSRKLTTYNRASHTFETHRELVITRVSSRRKASSRQITNTTPERCQSRPIDDSRKPRRCYRTLRTTWCGASRGAGRTNTTTERARFKDKTTNNLKPEHSSLWPSISPESG